MLPFDDALADFERWHTHPWNRRCHVVGLLTLTVFVFALCRLVPVWGPIDGGVLLLVGTLGFDAWWCPRLALPDLVAGAACWWLAGLVAPWGLVVLFVVGFLAQAAGHRLFEGNRPAFTDDRVHLLVGPRWLVARFLTRLRATM